MGTMADSVDDSLGDSNQLHHVSIAAQVGGDDDQAAVLHDGGQIQSGPAAAAVDGGIQTQSTSDGGVSWAGGWSVPKL